MNHFVELENVRTFLTMNDPDWLYCRTIMYGDRPLCFQLESVRHSAWNYFTDVIARCDLQRETVRLIISSDIEQAVRRANVALQ